MLPLTPRLLVSTATALATWERLRRPEDAENDRAKADADRALASLRFVHFAGFWSHFSHEIGCSSWPLPRSERIEELAEFAEQRRGLAPKPLAGDVFLLASFKADRHVLGGIVARVEVMKTTLNGNPAFVCITIEGATGRAGTADDSRGLTSVRVVRRRLSPAFGDCFLRWSDLESRISRAEVEYKVPSDLITLDRAHRRRAA
jgi:hypothetical protein